MKNNFYEIIEFPFHSSNSGTLMALENASLKQRDSLPFDIKKVLVIKDFKSNDVRGGHTHHKTRQIIFAINGSCTVSLDDGKRKEQVLLDNLSRGLTLEPYVWHTMENFKPGTILLVLADKEYDENDYIRNYDDFLKYLK